MKINTEKMLENGFTQKQVNAVQEYMNIFEASNKKFNNKATLISMPSGQEIMVAETIAQAIQEAMGYDLRVPNDESGDYA